MQKKMYTILKKINISIDHVRLYDIEEPIFRTEDDAIARAEELSILKKDVEYVIVESQVSVINHVATWHEDYQYGKKTT